MLKFDRKDRRLKWVRARLAEGQYSSRLLQVVRQIKSLVDAFQADGTQAGSAPLVSALSNYAGIIGPWSEAVARYMLADVSRRDEMAWKRHGDEMGRALRREIRDAPTGHVFRELLAENVGLITSLPRNAAVRVHALVQEGMVRSTRSADIAVQILETSRVTANRAKLIARTEVSRAAVTLTQARAMSIGSQGYIWRTVEDADVRPEHRRMEGVYVAWNDPPSFPEEPSLGPYHAGCGPNCRCFPEPVLPDF